MRFAFLDRWQQSLRDVMSDRPERDGILGLLELRDRQLEDHLAGPGWEDYTPADTNITVGNGTQTARKRVHADGTVDFTWRLVWGSSTAFTGSAIIGLPVTPKGVQVGVCRYLDQGTRHYVGCVEMTSAGGLLLHTEAGTGIVGATTPYTFTTSDTVDVAGTIEPEDT